jgi:cytochrome P450
MATAIAFTVLLLASLAWLYWRALPKPLPDIPHNRDSAGRVAGDLPGLLAHVRKTKEIASFAFQQCRNLQSPLVQVFLRPFSPPILFLDDPRETEDILLRRTREFDRAPSTAAFFKPIVPRSTMVRLTDNTFREQRRMWQDVMAPQFLRQAVAPNVHRSALELVELWTRKAQLADGRPFEALDDLELAAFDAIWIAMLGTRLSGLKDEIGALETEGATAGSEGVIDEEASLVQGLQNLDGPVTFPKAPRSVMHHGIAYINATVERIMRSPFPAKHHWFLRQARQYKYYSAFKDREIDGLVRNARRRFEKLAAAGDIVVEDGGDTCAMDLVLRREAIAFAKTGKRSPASDDRAMRDELAMLLVAGHETTAITLGWGLKLLADNQSGQTKLRQALQSAFSSLPAGSVPSASEIISTNIPYLDGTLEEILRFANTVPLLVRSATVDTTILGYHVPKGTHVMCNAQFMQEPLHVPDKARSPSSKAAWDRRGTEFATQHLHRFMPERWIKTTDGGLGEEFNPSSLTRMQFSIGPRGCFGSYSHPTGSRYAIVAQSLTEPFLAGKKLAMQQLRIFVVLLIWNFEFLPVPDELNSPWGHQKILRPPQQCYIRPRLV